MNLVNPDVSKLFRHPVPPVSNVSIPGKQHMLLLPPCGEKANLQRSCVAVWLPPAGLFDELAEELILKLGVGQTHLQGTLGQ